MKKKFQADQKRKEKSLLKWGDFLWSIVANISKLSLFGMKVQAILLGFIYDIFVKLAEVSYNNEYLNDAKIAEIQIQQIMLGIGE